MLYQEQDEDQEYFYDWEDLEVDDPEYECACGHYCFDCLGMSRSDFM